MIKLIGECLVITRIKNLFFKKPIPTIIKTEVRQPYYSFDNSEMNSPESIQRSLERSFQQPPPMKIPEIHGMDKKLGIEFAMDNASPIKSSFNQSYGINPLIFSWYANYSFIGYQLCAILSQHWLIDKCCRMPAEDAIRKWYDITINSGEEVGPEIIDAMNTLDIKYNVQKNLTEFIYFGRMFGIRLAYFVIDNNDPRFYEKPFNIDSITPGSYRGIAQIDPYWTAPELDAVAAGDPSSIHFYEPTWWRTTGKTIHRSHLIIYRTEEVADILKPSYFYGGIPLPQKIMERVYAAERTANEAPMLAMTKRLDILKTDMSQAVANQGVFEQRLQQYAFNRDNYGTKVIDLTEDMQQFDTALAELDTVIMTQYQIVAAAADVPAVKLLGTTPKGFNATGEYEEASYHQMLECEQYKVKALVERHHEILIRSEIMPEFNIAEFSTQIKWKELDAMTAEEQALLNKTNAETGALLTQAGAIDGTDQRQRIIADQNSGYNGLIDEEAPIPEPENEPQNINNEENTEETQR